LLRTESRGVHYREDYPQTDNDAWLLESRATLEKGNLRLHTRPPEMLSLRPSGGVVPYFEMLKRMIAAHADVGGHH
jgi:succinate dehydrogenase / fumarate reductase flavoprotein subunit